MKKCALFGDLVTIGMMRSLLKEREFGYVEARDTPSAIKLLNMTVSDIAFILLELNAQKIDGIGLLEEIRSSPALNHLPVILFSTEATKENVSKAAALGIDGYIVQPFNSAIFNHTIEKTLAKTSVDYAGY